MSGLSKRLEIKVGEGGSQEPFPGDPTRAVEIINITERVACDDEMVIGHPEVLEGRDNMLPSDKDVPFVESKEDLINQACNEVINDMMDRFIEEIANEDELALQKQALITEIMELKNVVGEASNLNELGDGLGSKDEEVGEFRIEVLGIDHNEWGLETPDCAKKCKRRGRKSLSELRNMDGSSEGQVKLTFMFDTGKGKYLPKEP